ncbi:hypothetical protein [Angustibacter luteus]|uniref:Uncharacterized protein n=1 Tax=Angustibacter luteus TaxID=658456 RepID=A0ABW1JF78_9ACTN
MLGDAVGLDVALDVALDVGRDVAVGLVVGSSSEVDGLDVEVVDETVAVLGVAAELDARP